jgi:hypothetical protein
MQKESELISNLKNDDKAVRYGYNYKENLHC